MIDLIKRSKNPAFPWVFEISVPYQFCRTWRVPGFKTRKKKEAVIIALKEFNRFEPRLAEYLQIKGEGDES